MKKKINITRINPVAKAMLMLRKAKQIVKPKKGKGSYDRQKENRNVLRNEELWKDKIKEKLETRNQKIAWQSLQTRTQEQKEIWIMDNLAEQLKKAEEARKNMTEIQRLVEDLYWEYDRMSGSGQQTLDKLAETKEVNLWNK